jgi:GNAT superfamily N-acetyltransferase
MTWDRRLVHIEAVDGSTMGPATAEEIAAVERAYAEADAPHMPPVVAESLRLSFIHGNGHGLEGMHVARDESGRVVGWAGAELSYWDNLDSAFLEATVHPAARRQGAGTALLDAVTDFCSSRRRTNLISATWIDNPAESFLTGRGFVRAIRNVQRRLDVGALDWSALEATHDEALKAAHEYELVALVGPTPDDMLESMVAVWAAINDAPLDDFKIDDDEFSVERLQAYDRAMQDRQITLYRLLARRRSDHAWAGHTIVCVDPRKAGWADQEDTTVVRVHRGHRLGLLLKSAMLIWLREAEPQIGFIDTWNAASNTHMIAVNEAIGCRPVGESHLWQKVPA